MTFQVITPSVQGPVRAAVGTDAATAAAGKGIGFADLLDVVNPLQHIPVVSQIYRHLSGDVIRAPFRLAGGALFGGPLGAAFAAGGILLDAARGAGSDNVAQPVPATPAFEARGGWMVAATRGRAPAAAIETTQPALAAVPVRRGGWLAAAAYAHTDYVNAARAGSLRGRA